MKAAQAAGGQRLDRRTLLALLGPMLAYPIAGIDPETLNLNLSAVSTGLGPGAGNIGLLAGASTLVVAASVLAAGSLGDRLGLRRVLLFGLGAYAVVETASCFAPNYPVLLILRLLAGVGLAAILGVTMALVATSVPEHLRARAIGLTMAVYTLLYGLAPLISGWVVDALGWRALFSVTALVAAVALGLTWRFSHEPARHPDTGLDVAGVALFGVVLLGLVVGLGAVPAGWGPRVWLPLIVSGVAGAGLFWRERRAKDPALDLRLFTKGAFLIAVVATVATNIFAAGLGVVVGQLGDYVLGLSAQSIGLLYLPGTLLVALASVLAGRAVAARTARPVLVVGLLFVGVGGLVLAATASPVMSVLVIVLAVWLSNLGGFVSGTAAADTIISQAPPGRSGSVASVQPAFAMTGFALGPTIVFLLLDVFFRHAWLSNAASAGVPIADAEEAVTAVTTTVMTTPGASGYATNLVALADGLSVGVDYTTAVRATFLVLALIPLAVAVLAWFAYPRRKLTSTSA